jgi:hypothetical protein
MSAPKKIKKPIVRFGYRNYVFDTVEQAAKAIAFFGKLRPVQYESDSTGCYYRPADDEQHSEVEMGMSHEFRETPKRIALPAPKRGTVACQNCESVSVRPGTACESCGTISPLL